MHTVCVVAVAVVAVVGTDKVSVHMVDIVAVDSHSDRGLCNCSNVVVS